MSFHKFFRFEYLKQQQSSYTIYSKTYVCCQKEFFLQPYLFSVPVVKVTRFQLPGVTFSDIFCL